MCVGCPDPEKLRQALAARAENDVDGEELCEDCDERLLADLDRFFTAGEEAAT